MAREYQLWGTLANSSKPEPEILVLTRKDGLPGPRSAFHATFQDLSSCSRLRTGRPRLVAHRVTERSRDVALHPRAGLYPAFVA
jgi:hypothetical protein